MVEPGSGDPASSVQEIGSSDEGSIDTDQKLTRQQKQTYKALKQLDWESVSCEVGELPQVQVKLTYPSAL